MHHAVALLIVLCAALPASAQQTPCVERAVAMKKLSTDFGENRVALGLTSDGNVLEILASNSGTWTILVTTPQGVGCGVASGEAWSKMPARHIKDLDVGL